MAKSGAIPPKPKPQSVNQWVGGTVAVSEEDTKRITVDLPPDLHRRVMLGCLQEGTKLTKVIRQLLDERFPDIEPMSKKA